MNDFKIDKNSEFKIGLQIAVLVALFIIVTQLNSIINLIKESNSNTHWITEFMGTNLMK